MYKMFGLDFLLDRKGFYVATQKSVEKWALGKLYIKIKYGLFSTVYIKNSLHKISSGGHNWDDFTKSDFRRMIYMLSKIFQENMMTAKVTGAMEFGVNIRIPFDTWQQAIYHPIGERQKMEANGKAKQYGTRFKLETKLIKIYSPLLKIKYSKSSETKPTYDIIRCEVRTGVSVLRGKGITINTVGDLLYSNVMSQLGRELIRDFSEVKFSKGLPADLSYPEFKLYTMMMFDDPQVNSFRNKLLKGSTRKKAKRDLKKLLDRSKPDVNIVAKIKDTWHRLSHSQYYTCNIDI